MKSAHPQLRPGDRRLLGLHPHRRGAADAGAAAFLPAGLHADPIAFLFLFYEFFGIVTNLFGGWIASRSGVKVTLFGGLALQIFSLLMLALSEPALDALAFRSST